MRSAQLIVAAISLVSSVQAWRLALYREACDNINQSDHYLIEGSSTMPYCWGVGTSDLDLPGDDIWCGYYSSPSTASNDSDDKKKNVKAQKCHPNGQFSEALSFKILEGQAGFWEEFQLVPWLTDSQGCKKPYEEGEKQLRRREDGEVDDGQDAAWLFEAENKCRDIDGEKEGKKIRGFRARDYVDRL